MPSDKDETEEAPSEMRDLPPEKNPKGGRPVTGVPITGVPETNVPITGAPIQEG